MKGKLGYHEAGWRSGQCVSTHSMWHHPLGSLAPLSHTPSRKTSPALWRGQAGGVGRGEGGPAVDGGTVVDKRMAEAGFILDPEEERALTYTPPPSALGGDPIHGGKPRDTKQ